MEKINLFIVEDQRLLIDSYLMFFEKQESIEVVGYSGCGKEAILQIQQTLPDVILLDIRLKNSSMDGIDLIEDIKNISKNIKILVISQFDELLLIENLMQRGIHGFRAKNSSLNEIKAAIMNVYNGRYDFLYAVGQKSEIKITDKERTILKLLTEGQIIVQIADKVGVSEDSINRSLRQLRKKFKADTTIQLIGMISKSGLI